MSAIFSTPPPGCTCCINNEVYEETPCPSFASKLVVSIEEVDPPIVSCCNICLEPLAFTGCEHSTRDRAVTLKKCGHVFGRTCLDKWLEDATTCPMCRVEVKESMEWLKNAFIGSIFGAAGLREELEHVMAERTLQIRNLMAPEIIDEDDQD